MRTRIILIILVAMVAVSAGFLCWRSIRAARLARFKKPAAAPVAVVKKKPAFPSVPKNFSNPKVAIVMDDFGYNMNNLDELFSIKMPVTFSILPGLPYSTQISNLAYGRGYEVILHLPLESDRKDVREEFDTIKTDMREKDVRAMLEKATASVPHARGISNHMGSKATEDERLMTIIFKYLKQHNLYFLDSLTAHKSVCKKVAYETAVHYGRRDIFLDNSNDSKYIKKEMLELRRLAFKKGWVVAVCHDRKNTMAVLKKMMPEMAQEGIEFVSLSKLVN